MVIFFIMIRFIFDKILHHLGNITKMFISIQKLVEPLIFWTWMVSFKEISDHANRLNEIPCDEQDFPPVFATSGL